MKKCPKCKAEIQEEARFCLYCMTSFEEKQTIETPKENSKQWLYIIAAVFVFALVAVSILLFVPTSNNPHDTNGNSIGSSISSDSDTSAENTTSTRQQSDGATGEEASSPSSSSQTQNFIKSENNATNNTSGNTTTNNPSANSSSNNTTTSHASSTGSSNTTTTNTSSGTTTSNQNTIGDTTSSTPTTTQPKYNYMEATIENAYPPGYSTIHTPENAIVITKVNFKEESGNYVIPDTIDGKNVAAIMPSAFSDSSICPTVKSVTLPSTVRTIWSNAFKDCFHLTDLYIKSGAIEIFEDAFPDPSKRKGKLTIHCKSDCINFDYYYYRNIANRYDAEYEEWNG